MVADITLGLGSLLIIMHWRCFHFVTCSKWTHMIGWFRDLWVLALWWTWELIMRSMCLGSRGGRVSRSWSPLLVEGLPCGCEGLVLLPHYLYIVIIHLKRTAIRDWLHFSSALLDDLWVLGSWRGDVRLWMVADLIWRTAFCVYSA